MLNGRRFSASALVTELSVNGLGVARALGRMGVPVVALAGGEAAPETASRYLSRVVARDASGMSLLDQLVQVAGELPEKPVLFPITDESVRVVAENLAELESHVVLPFSEPIRILELLDKTAFLEHARDMGFPVPRTASVARGSSLELVAREIRFPVVLKPARKSDAYQSAGFKKAYILGTAEELLHVYSQISSVEPEVVVQEFVEGEDCDVYFCLQYYGDSPAPLASFVGRKLRQWPPLDGGTAACEPVYEPRVQQLTTDFFRRMGIRGICSMEYKRDRDSGEFLMIEPTVGRTDWQSAVADANGTVIPYVAYCDLIGEPIPPQRPSRFAVRWANLADDRKAFDHYQVRAELGRIEWLLSLRPPIRWAYWSIEDPKPFLTILRSKVEDKLRALFPGRVDGARTER